MPKWLLFLTVTTPTPVDRAFAIARSMAMSETTWPMPFRASITAMVALGSRTSNARSGTIYPASRPFR